MFLWGRALRQECNELKGIGEDLGVSIQVTCDAQTLGKRFFGFERNNENKIAKSVDQRLLRQ